MPPKSKCTREQIIDAAATIVRSGGMSALTARSLGEKLSCSARPIFTVFASMDEVKDEVYKYARRVYSEYVASGLKEDIAFKGVGKAYIGFAEKEPQFFKELFMRVDGEPYSQGNALVGIDENFDDILKSIEDGYGLDRADAQKIYFHMWVYTHGLAVMIATGVCSFGADEISTMITEMFHGVLTEITAGGKDDRS